MPEKSLSKDTSLHRLLEEFGARFRDGTPADFGSVTDELNTLQSGTGIYLHAAGSVIALRGYETLDFLHRITTNSVKHLAPGQYARTTFLTEKGRIVDSVGVAAIEDEILLLGSAVHREKLLGWLDRYIIMEDISVEDVSGRIAALSVIGPDKEAISTRLGCSDFEPNRIYSVQTSGVEFRYIPASYRMQPGHCLILCEIDHAAPMLRVLLDTGGIRIAGEDAFTLYRIEHGIPAAPNELNDRYNPHETGLLDEVDFDKGCYIGQEVVARLDTYEKVSKRLCRLVFDGDTVPEPGTKLTEAGGNPAGVVTTAVYSPVRKTAVGIGMLKIKHLQKRTPLSVELNGSVLHGTPEPLR